MLREEVTIGMTVEFGRANGEKTLGKVVKKNPTKAKIKILEQRGSRSPVGAVWNVPYSMMTAVGQGQEVPKSKLSPKLPKALFGNPEDYQILLAISACYDELSPETLTRDGEASKAHVITRKGELGRKLKALFMAYGREVREDECVELVGYNNRRN